MPARKKKQVNHRKYAPILNEAMRVYRPFRTTASGATMAESWGNQFIPDKFEKIRRYVKTEGVPKVGLDRKGNQMYAINVDEVFLGILQKNMNNKAFREATFKLFDKY